MVVLVVGESLVDVVVPHGSTGQAAVVRRPGGSPMNVAVGLARLAVPTRLVTRLGDDDDGRLVREHLASSHVALAPGAVDPATTTGVATAHLDADGVASYDFAVTWDLPPTPLPEDCRALHVGSIGAGVHPGRDTVVALAAEAHRDGLPVSFDPNARPAFTPDADVAWQDVLELASLCDLVKLSDEDAAFLQPGREVLDVARAVLERGPALVVVTGGGGVATAVTRSGVVVVAESRKVEVADTVGAGDSFMAALVAATLPDDARALHVGSIGAGVRPGRDAVVALASEAHAAGLPVSFDPNARPAFTPDAAVAWQDVLDLAALCDLVKLSDEDARFFQPGREVVDVAHAVLERGPALVVVTGGGGVATAVSRTGVVVVAESREVEVADTVGAGDSFMAALVAATLPDRVSGAWAEGPTHSQVAEYLSAAHAAAAVTVTRRGADPPRLSELPAGWPRV